MIDDDDRYQLDAQGNRVLIGLTVEETAEFFRLEDAIAESCPRSQLAGDDWSLPEDGRWLELFEKHESARRPFLNVDHKTKH
ncbi:hypothetical protein HNR60_002943 [Rhodopseudomonas rhenobacensis]|uniref:Uncharacterized protein n=1 Tax=Rhodopseudomonas rhenobacensis TaxID=87461 RepID=A0A7W7Z540_9BRAD|nr:hypothetical protein [Rhodopseudomonas rhenobacensis]MBB5048181.1 hypothetical protein [Rhodopseudomonas rhenobacensis]